MNETVEVICRPAGWILKPRITWVAAAPAPSDPRMDVFTRKAHWRCVAAHDVIGARGASPQAAYEAWLMMHGRWTQRYG